MTPLELPDTSEAVAKALDQTDVDFLQSVIAPEFPVDNINGPNRLDDAKTAIAAHNAELERQRYVIVKVGTVPPWMISSFKKELLGCATKGVNHRGADYCSDCTVTSLYFLDAVMEDFITNYIERERVDTWKCHVAGCTQSEKEHEQEDLRQQRMWEAELINATEDADTERIANAKRVLRLSLMESEK